MERLDFTFINYIGNKEEIELFSGFQSFSQIINKNLFAPSQSFKIPVPVYPAPLPTTKLSGNIIFDAYGNLFTLDNVNGLPVIQIICTTYPYRALLNAMVTTKILIKKIRISTSSALPQLTTPITRFSKIPLTNRYKEENYIVTISPNNVQPLLNEFERDILIDSASGLYYTIQPNETVKWTLDFEFIN